MTKTFLRTENSKGTGNRKIIIDIAFNVLKTKVKLFTENTQESYFTAAGK